MSNLLEVKEIGNYRIKVYQDEDTPCPCADWTMAGLYFWDDESGRLSSACNCHDLGESAKEVLVNLVCKYVQANKIIHYINAQKKLDYRMLYDKKEHAWRLEELYNGKWYAQCSFAPCEIKNGSCMDELCDILEEDDLCALLGGVKKIAFYEWESTGYCQGDYVKGYAFCDKALFAKNVDTNTKKWRDRAIKLLKDDVKIIGTWIGDDVKGYILEKKIPYKKVFEDSSRKSEEGYDWEEIGSCCGFYMNTDELIDEAFLENGIKKVAV